MLHGHTHLCCSGWLLTCLNSNSPCEYDLCDDAWCIRPRTMKTASHCKQVFIIDADYACTLHTVTTVYTFTHIRAIEFHFMFNSSFFATILIFNTHQRWSAELLSIFVAQCYGILVRRSYFGRPFPIIMGDKNNFQRFSLDSLAISQWEGIIKSQTIVLFKNCSLPGRVWLIMKNVTCVVGHFR